MSQSTFSSFALLSIVVLAGAGCLQSNQAINEADTSSDNEITEAFTGSLSDALALGQALECTWSSDDGSGTTYLKDGNMYAVTTYQGMTAHMVTNGTCTHIWEESKNDGVKFCSSEDFSDDLTEAESDIEAYASSNVDYDVQVDCTRSSIDDDVFAPPTDVNFINPFDLFSL